MEIANKERQPPLLLISHGEQNEKHTFYSVLENRFHTTTIPILCNKHVLASSYGWLVLVNVHTNYCCLWNPISMDIIELPELKMSCIYSRCVLTKPPTEPDCHILFNSASNLEQAFCRIGDDEFVAQSLEPEDDVRILAIGSFQGKIYGFVGLKYQFVTVHFVGKTLELRPILVEGRQTWHVSIASRPWVTWHRDYLIESPCDGELLLVRKMHASCYIQDHCDFRVYQIDTNRMECMELENIGQRTIFVSYLGDGFCCSSIRMKPNSIYYTLGEREGRNLYIFDLDDRSTTLLLPCPTAGRFQSVAFWVEHQDFHNFIN